MVKRCSSAKTGSSPVTGKVFRNSGLNLPGPMPSEVNQSDFQERKPYE
jgi:hypothetical protein